MIKQAYVLRVLCSYIHIFYTYIHIYLLFYVLQQTMNNFAQLFTDGYKITVKKVV